MLQISNPIDYWKSPFSRPHTVHGSRSRCQLWPPSSTSAARHRLGETDEEGFTKRMNSGQKRGLNDLKGWERDGEQMSLKLR